MRCSFGKYICSHGALASSAVVPISVIFPATVVRLVGRQLEQGVRLEDEVPGDALQGFEIRRLQSRAVDAQVAFDLFQGRE